MATSESSGAPKKRGRPATTVEEREQRLQNLAYDVVEKQLRSGDVSSQLLTLLLKGGSRQGALELENLETTNRLLRARIESMESMARMEASIEEAMEAFRTYTGDYDDHDD
jgi:hypothetical protein